MGFTGQVPVVNSWSKAIHHCKLEQKQSSFAAGQQGRNSAIQCCANIQSSISHSLINLSNRKARCSHHFESLLITRIRAPFSSLSRWLSVRSSLNA